jgi:hypothetical protein
MIKPKRNLTTLVTGRVHQLVIALFFILVLPSCGKTEKVTVTVHHVVENHSPMGCVGTSTETYVQREDGRMSMLCGAWGNPGDKLTGYWSEGGLSSRGFHTER